MVWTSGHGHRVAAESQGIWHLTQSTCPRGGQNMGVCSMTLRCMEYAVKWKIPAPKNHPAVVPVQLHLATLPNRSPSVNTIFTVNSFLVCHKLQILTTTEIWLQTWILLNVIFSIIIRKFAQYCQILYFIRPKRPFGNCYVLRKLFPYWENTFVWQYNSYLKTGMYIFRKVFIWKILGF